MFGIVATITVVGIVFTSINIDKYSLLSVICHLINGWSVLIALPFLLTNIGLNGVIFTVLGGIMYSVGALIYWKGANIKYMHSIFHFFCLAGTIFHFFSIYLFIL
jgi:hemolysin III